jgi:hypothetical protein
MRLFGFGAKRKPAQSHAKARPAPIQSVARRPRPKGLEVAEFRLDEDLFSTLFGTERSSDASDTAFNGDGIRDPWGKKTPL